VTDPRSLPRIPTALAMKAVLVLCWSRLGSLNALEMTRGAKFWKNWPGTPLCSADTVARIVSGMDAGTLRQGIHHVYERLKRNKALVGFQGLGVAVLDGHETSASCRRRCAGCSRRVLSNGQVQFYHRNVTLMLLTQELPGRPAVRLLLDVEPQRAGEGEIAAALRLLERVLAAYPRAFDVVLADAYYAMAPFLNLLHAHGKDAVVVLKNEERDSYQDAAGLWTTLLPQSGSYKNRLCQWWDTPDICTWPGVRGALRVVRSEEHWTVRSQLTKEITPQMANWVWLTTFSTSPMRTEQVVRLAHLRWDIENHGFNEMVNGWHTDHVYRHHPHAIECFLLLFFLAYNLFHSFFALNLKPALRRGRTMIFLINLITTDLHQFPSRSPLSVPP